MSRSSDQWVFDASALINLVAMPDPARLLARLGGRHVAPRQAANEVRRLRRPDQQGSSPRALLDSLVRVVDLSSEELAIFGALVGAPSPNDLGDGEAAVLAVTSVRGGVSVLDDAKAIQLASRRTPPLNSRSTASLLRHIWDHAPDERDLVQVSLSDALTYARMSVDVEHLEWVAAVIPASVRENAPSLPQATRLATGGRLAK